MQILFKSAALGLAFFAVASSIALAQQDRSAAAENFTQADANGDGALSINEFTRFIDLNAEDRLGNAGRIRRTGQYGTAFARVDVNRNGLATRDEIAALAGQ